MPDLLMFAVMVAACGGIGLPLTRLLPAERFPLRALAAPALGSGAAAVLLSVGYRWGASLPALTVTGAGLALAGIGHEAWRVHAAPPEAATRRGLRVGVAAWALASVLLLLPRFVGGDQLAAYQGNAWDTFGYLESSTVLAQKGWAEVSGAQRSDMLRDPLLAAATPNVFARPGVALLHAAFTRVAPGQAYRLHYVFLLFFLAQVVPVTLLVLRRWAPAGRPLALAAAAVAFPVGFWGQYVLDINAWSCVSTLPLLVLLFLQLVEVAVPEPARSGRLRAAGFLAVTVVELLYLYPEGLLYYLGALLPLVALFLGLRWWRAGRWAPGELVPLLGLAGVAGGLLFWEGTLRFVLAQIGVARNPVLDEWWPLFEGFFAGRDGSFGSGVTWLIDLSSGVFGLYFATPGPGASPAEGATIRLVLALILAALLAGLAALAAGWVSAPKGRAADPSGRARLRVVALGAIALTIPAALMALRGDYWLGGKGLSTASPVLVAALALPLLVGLTRPALRPVPWAVGAWVLFQLGCGLARLGAAREPTGIHYAAPYPSIQHPVDKRTARLDLRPLEPLLQPGDKVLLQPMNHWLERELMVFLRVRGVEFVKATPVSTYYGPDTTLGWMVVAWQPEIGIAADARGFTLAYRDGRPPIRVVSGE